MRVYRHWPSRQTSVVPQVSLQSPQCSVPRVRSTQSRSHTVIGDRQSLRPVHRPATQTVSPAQRLPVRPQ